MRLEADKKELANTIGLAMLASGRSCKDVALQNVLLRVENGQGSVESYDTHVYSRAVFPAKGDNGLEFAVEGSRFENLIEAADEGQIQFEIGPDGVKVGFGRAVINLRTFPLDKYVRMEVSGMKPMAHQIRVGVLSKAMEFVTPFIGKDAQQPARMLAEIRGGRLLAGDGNRIGVASFVVDGTNPSGIDFGLKIPQAVVSNINRWLKAQMVGEEESLIDVNETEDFYFLTTGAGSILGWRKPEHEFAAIEPFLDKMEAADGGDAFTLKVDKESFVRMVNALSVVLESGSEKISFGMTGSQMMPFLQGTALDSRNVASQNQIQIVVDKPIGDGDSSFALRYSHLLDTLKMMRSPVVTCNVRKPMSIIRIVESQPEVQLTALLTLMSEA